MEIKIKKNHFAIVENLRDKIRAFDLQIETLALERMRTHEILWGFFYKEYNLEEDTCYTYDKEQKKIITTVDKDTKIKRELIRKWNKFVKENKSDILDLYVYEE